LFNSLALRLASMVFKFLFLIVAAKKLSPVEIADFGTTNASILLLTYFLGLDLYIATSRKIGMGGREYHSLLSNQIVACSVFFLVVAAVLISSAPAKVPTVPIGLFLALLLLELVSQEFYRLNVSHGDYMIANILFFTKSGLWTGLATLGILAGWLQTIEQILLLWLIGVGAACAYGYRSVRSYTKGFLFCPSLSTFLSEIKKNSLIFSSSVSLVVLGNFDKIFLSSIGDAETVAAYVFYASLGGAAMTLIYSGVVNPNYSKIVDPENTSESIRKTILSIAISVTGLLLCAFLMLAILIDPLLEAIGQTYLSNEKGLLVIVGIGVLFNAIGLIPHFFLLASESDKQIALASIMGVGVHVATIYPFSQAWGVSGVAVSATSGFGTLFLIKSAFSLVSLARQT
jgi:O-antigen/teichoic acid export membrane protein